MYRKPPLKISREGERHGEIARNILGWEYINETGSNSRNDTTGGVGGIRKVYVVFTINWIRTN